MANTDERPKAPRDPLDTPVGKTMQVNSERRIIVKTPIELVEWQFEALYRAADPKLDGDSPRYSEGQGDPTGPGAVGGPKDNAKKTR